MDRNSKKKNNNNKNKEYIDFNTFNWDCIVPEWYWPGGKSRFRLHKLQGLQRVPKSALFELFFNSNDLLIGSSSFDTDSI